MPIDRSKIRENLLTVYSQNYLEQIDDFLVARTFFPGIEREETQQIMEGLTKEEMYLGIIGELKLFKASIEDELSGAIILTADDELKTILYCVVLNWAIGLGYDHPPDRYDSKMQLLHDLIKGEFIETNKWDQRLADHYAYVYPIIRDWYSFFISYTNKEAYDINRRYETILALNPVSSTVNQVARRIAEKLRLLSLPRAFIDEKEIEYGEKFKEKIDSAIKRSHTFVQFISEATFFTIGQTNWCLYEFEKYKEFLEEQRRDSQFYYQAMSNNIFFVVAGDSLESVMQPLPLIRHRKWLADIRSALYIKFYSNCRNGTPTEAALDYLRFDENIRQLAIAIIRARKQLIDNIPAPG